METKHTKKQTSHKKCLVRLRDSYMDWDENIEYMRLDLHNLMEIDDGKIVKRDKSGQKVWIGYKNKKKEKVTFIAHIYCPWCGKKY